MLAGFEGYIEEAKVRVESERAKELEKKQEEKALHFRKITRITNPATVAGALIGIGLVAIDFAAGGAVTVVTASVGIAIQFFKRKQIELPELTEKELRAKAKVIFEDDQKEIEARIKELSSNQTALLADLRRTEEDLRDKFGVDVGEETGSIESKPKKL